VFTPFHFDLNYVFVFFSVAYLHKIRRKSKLFKNISAGSAIGRQEFFKCEKNLESALKLNLGSVGLSETKDVVMPYCASLLSECPCNIFAFSSVIMQSTAM